VTSGDPFNVVSSGAFSDTEDTSQSVPGATTTVVDTLVLLLCTNGANFTTNTWSSLTNSDLATLTDQASFHDTIQNGGGALVATGEKASAGTYGTTTVTSQRTSAEAAISIAFKPAVVDADTGSTISPAALAGTDSNVFNETAKASPSVLAGTDANVFRILGADFPGCSHRRR
jgi:hypothetical protein